MSDDGRVLAALEVLGWPDDREASAHVEEDGYEVVPAGHYWSLVCDVLAAADLAAELESGDLPEGQQSNPVPPDLIDILDRRAGRKHSEFGSVVSCLGEILAVHEARVRADVAGAITADLQAARRAAAAPASMESLDRALRIVARHAVAPAESVVGAPTPVSSPSDVAAPRDALSDQDFADLNETIADLRDAAWRAYLAEDDVSAAVNAAVRTAVMLTNRRWIAARERVQTRHASRPDGYCVMCRWPDGSLMSWPCPDYVDSQVGALPEDEGTRPHPEAVCGCPVTVQRIRVVRHTEDCSRRQSAQRFIDAHFSDEPDVDDEGTRQEGLINVDE